MDITITTESGQRITPAEAEFIKGTAKRLAVIREHDIKTYTITHVATGCCLPYDFKDKYTAHVAGLAVYRYSRELWADAEPMILEADRDAIVKIIKKHLKPKRNHKSS